MAEDLLGKVLLGSYRITRPLGKGGMGIVYEAQHLRLPKKVAVKVLHREAAESEELFARFRQEAEVASSLGHSHICEVTDFSPPDAPFPFIVMEHLDGVDLGTHMESVSPLPLKQAIRISIDVLSALHAAHARDIVHRDLKPQNIYLCRRDNREDFVKLLDFGISKMRSGGGGLTKPLTVLGTPSYMAPEQVQGRGDLIDGRTDIWAMGVVLYEMLTGQVAFPGHDVLSAVYRVVFEEPKPVKLLRRDAPLVLCEIVARAMSKDPAKRYGAARDMEDDLLRAAEATGEWEKEEDTSPEVSRTEKRPPLLSMISEQEPQPVAGGEDPALPRGATPGTIRRFPAIAGDDAPVLPEPSGDMATTLPQTVAGVGAEPAVEPQAPASPAPGGKPPRTVPLKAARPQAAAPAVKRRLPATITAPGSAAKPATVPAASEPAARPSAPEAEAAEAPAAPSLEAPPPRRPSVSMASGLGAVTTTTMRGLIRSRWRMVLPVALVLAFAGLGGVTAVYLLSDRAQQSPIKPPTGASSSTVSVDGGIVRAAPAPDTAAGPAPAVPTAASLPALVRAPVPVASQPAKAPPVATKAQPAADPPQVKAAPVAKAPSIASPPAKTAPVAKAPSAAPAPAKTAPVAAKAPAPASPASAAKAPLRIRRELGDRSEAPAKAPPSIRIKRDLQ